MNSTEKILIIRLSSIGDIVQCSAAPRHLKKRFPRGIVHWLVGEDNKELVQHNSHIDEVISFNRKLPLKEWILLCRKLSQDNYTHIYDAHNNIRSFILTRIVKSPHFIRRSKNRFKRFLLFWLKINTFGPQFVAVESFVSPLKKWGITFDNKGGELKLPQSTYDKVGKLIPQNRECIAIAPATAWPKKTWPLRYWKTLLQGLLSTTQYHFIILGGPKDNFCQELILDPQRTLSLQGKLSLLESAAAVSFCKTLIVADTGLLHMAECLEKDVIGILGPTPFGHPARPTSIGLQTNLWCQPCTKDGSGPCLNPKYQKCMTSITPTLVEEAFSKIDGRT